MNIKTLRSSLALCGKPVQVSGWVRTLRKQKKISFIELNDGSSLKSMQIIAPPSAIPTDLAVGSSVQVTGELRKGLASHGGELEVHASEGQLQVLGAVGASYPFQKKYQSLEFVREHLHLRSRTNTASAVLRTRHHISAAVRQYLDNSNFIEVHTPVLTSNDCEGAGELFRVRSSEKQSDFFNTDTYLTVSGQIHAEALACSMGRVYTFGPTFRAENSNTSRHLCEFWMIEPELSFATMDDAIDVAEGTLRATFQRVLEHCPEELDFFEQQNKSKSKSKSKNTNKSDSTQKDKDLSTSSLSSPSLPPPREVLEMVAKHESFARMTYTEAVAALSSSSFQGDIPIWGADLNSDQERWLVEQHCGYQPLVVTDYPTDIKPFYMRRNDDGKTVAAFDILFPGVGEIVGGSGREERLDRLESAMKEKQVEGLDWYVDLRRHGTVPHAGFGIGLERLVMACTGVKNVRDCIPFPRTPGSCPA